MDCKSPKACTILLRGPSKDLLNEVERNLQDCMLVSRNVALEPKLLPGGGAVEMALAVALRKALLLPLDDLLHRLDQDTEQMRAMRQTSPFAGVLTPKERWAIYDTFATGAPDPRGGNDRR